MPAERRRTTAFDGGEHFQVQPVQPRSLLINEAFACRANDIGHLEWRPFHFFLCSFLDRFTLLGLENSAWSIGVPAALRWRSGFAEAVKANTAGA